MIDVPEEGLGRPEAGFEIQVTVLLRSIAEQAKQQTEPLRQILEKMD